MEQRFQNLANTQNNNKGLELIKQQIQAAMQQLDNIRNAKTNNIIIQNKLLNEKKEQVLYQNTMREEGKRAKDINDQKDLENRLVLQAKRCNQPIDTLLKITGAPELESKIDLTNQLILQIFGKEEPSIRDVILVRAMIIIQQLNQKIIDMENDITNITGQNSSIKQIMYQNMNDNLKLTDFITGTNVTNIPMLSSEIINIKSQVGQIANEMPNKTENKNIINKTVENLNKQINDNFTTVQRELSNQIDEKLRRLKNNTSNMELEADISDNKSNIENVWKKINELTTDIKLLKQQANFNVQKNEENLKILEQKVEMYEKNNKEKIENTSVLASQTFDQVCSILKGENKITMEFKDAPKITKLKSDMEINMKKIGQEIAILETNLRQLLKEEIEKVNNEKESLKTELTDLTEKNKKLIENKEKNLNNAITKQKNDMLEEVKIQISNEIQNKVAEEETNRTRKTNEINEEIIKIKKNIGILTENKENKQNFDKIQKLIDQQKTEIIELINQYMEERKKEITKVKTDSTKELPDKINQNKKQIEETLILKNKEIQITQIQEEIKKIKETIEGLQNKEDAKNIHDKIFSLANNNAERLDKIDISLAENIIFKKEEKKEEYIRKDKKKEKDWKDLNLKERMDNLVRDRKKILESQEEKNNKTIADIKTIMDKIKVINSNITALDTDTKYLKTQLKLRAEGFKSKIEIKKEKEEKEIKKEENELLNEQNDITTEEKGKDFNEQIDKFLEITNEINKKVSEVPNLTTITNMISEALSQFRIDLESENTINNNNKINQVDINNITEQINKIQEKINNTDKKELKKEIREDIQISFNEKEYLKAMVKKKIIEQMENVINESRTLDNKIEDNTKRINIITEKINTNSKNIMELEKKMPKKLSIKDLNIKIKKEETNTDGKINQIIRIDNNNKEEDMDNIENINNINTNSNINIINTNNQTNKYVSLIDEENSLKLEDNINEWNKINSFLGNFKFSLKCQNMDNENWRKLNKEQKLMFWKQKDIFRKNAEKQILNSGKSQEIIQASLNILDYYDNKIPMMEPNTNQIIGYENKPQRPQRKGNKNFRKNRKPRIKPKETRYMNKKYNRKNQFNNSFKENRYQSSKRRKFPQSQRINDTNQTNQENNRSSNNRYKKFSKQQQSNNRNRNNTQQYNRQNNYKKKRNFNRNRRRPNNRSQNKRLQSNQ